MVPFDQREGFIWIDGGLVPWGDAKMHVLTHGLHYGSGVFEGERVYGGRIFKLREHTLRLEESARLLGFRLPYSVETIEQACFAAAAANEVVDGYVRPFAWRGSEQMSIAAPKSRIHVAIAAWPLESYFSADARFEGLRLQASSWRRPDPATAPVHAKAAGLYVTSTLAKHQAQAAGYDDALLCDWRGYVAEATGANIFLCIDNALHTPIADCFLDGITRRTVIELARGQGISVFERRISPMELAEAREAFLTGTAAEVTPIQQIGEIKFRGRQMTNPLIKLYSDLVRSETPAEMEKSSA